MPRPSASIGAKAGFGQSLVQTWHPGQGLLLCAGSLSETTLFSKTHALLHGGISERDSPQGGVEASPLEAATSSIGGEVELLPLPELTTPAAQQKRPGFAVSASCYVASSSSDSCLTQRCRDSRAVPASLRSASLATSAEAASASVPKDGSLLKCRSEAGASKCNEASEANEAWSEGESALTMAHVPWAGVKTLRDYGLLRLSHGEQRATSLQKRGLPALERTAASSSSSCSDGGEDEEGEEEGGDEALSVISDSTQFSSASLRMALHFKMRGPDSKNASSQTKQGQRRGLASLGLREAFSRSLDVKETLDVSAPRQRRKHDLAVSLGKLGDSLGSISSSFLKQTPSFLRLRKTPEVLIASDKASPTEDLTKRTKERPNQSEAVPSRPNQSEASPPSQVTNSAPSAAFQAKCFARAGKAEELASPSSVQNIGLLEEIAAAPYPTKSHLNLLPSVAAMQFAQRPVQPSPWKVEESFSFLNAEMDAPRFPCSFSSSLRPRPEGLETPSFTEKSLDEEDCDPPPPPQKPPSPHPLSLGNSAVPSSALTRSLSSDACDGIPEDEAIGESRAEACESATTFAEALVLPPLRVETERGFVEISNEGEFRFSFQARSEARMFGREPPCSALHNCKSDLTTWSISEDSSTCEAFHCCACFLRQRGDTSSEDSREEKSKSSLTVLAFVVEVGGEFVRVEAVASRRTLRRFHRRCLTERQAARFLYASRLVAALQSSSPLVSIRKPNIGVFRLMADLGFTAEFQSSLVETVQVVRLGGDERKSEVRFKLRGQASESLALPLSDLTAFAASASASQQLADWWTCVPPICCKDGDSKYKCEANEGGDKASSAGGLAVREAFSASFGNSPSQWEEAAVEGVLRALEKLNIPASLFVERWGQCVRGYSQCVDLQRKAVAEAASEEQHESRKALMSADVDFLSVSPNAARGDSGLLSESRTLGGFRDTLYKRLLKVRRRALLRRFPVEAVESDGLVQQTRPPPSLDLDRFATEPGLCTDHLLSAFPPTHPGGGGSRSLPFEFLV